MSDTITAPADMLSHALRTTRRHIESGATAQERMRVLWAGAKNARDLAASDVVSDEFLQLAKDMGLVSELGRHANESLPHVLTWACRDMNPFGNRQHDEKH